MTCLLQQELLTLARRLRRSGRRHRGPGPGRAPRRSLRCGGSHPLQGPEPGRPWNRDRPCNPPDRHPPGVQQGSTGTQRSLSRRAYAAKGCSLREASCPARRESDQGMDSISMGERTMREPSEGLGPEDELPAGRRAVGVALVGLKRRILRAVWRQRPPCGSEPGRTGNRGRFWNPPDRLRRGVLRALTGRRGTGLDLCTQRIDAGFWGRRPVPQPMSPTKGCRGPSPSEGE